MKRYNHPPLSCTWSSQLLGLTMTFSSLKPAHVRGAVVFSPSSASPKQTSYFSLLLEHAPIEGSRVDIFGLHRAQYSTWNALTEYLANKKASLVVVWFDDGGFVETRLGGRK